MWETRAGHFRKSAEAEAGGENQRFALSPNLNWPPLQFPNDLVFPYCKNPPFPHWTGAFSENRNLTNAVFQGNFRFNSFSFQP